jgi:hypothetical protein
MGLASQICIEGTWREIPANPISRAIPNSVAAQFLSHVDTNPTVTF